VLDSSFLEDLNSTNGTYVNSRLVKKHALENGDLINIGSYQIKFTNEQVETEEEFNDDILEQTILLSPGQNLDPIDRPLPPRIEEKPKEIKEPQGNLQVLNGKSAGLILNLEKSLTTFGLPKIAIAGITKRGNKHFLVHVQGSKENMTLLNGEPVQKKATLLEENDIIEVAEVKLEFFIQ
jgi:pSer/pThr/pTyr-binding forkhead associated (FHA) protein